MGKWVLRAGSVKQLPLGNLAFGSVLSRKFFPKYTQSAITTLLCSAYICVHPFVFCAKMLGGSVFCELQKKLSVWWEGPGRDQKVYLRWNDSTACVLVAVSFITRNKRFLKELREAPHFSEILPHPWGSLGVGLEMVCQSGHTAPWELHWSSLHL